MAPMRQWSRTVGTTCTVDETESESNRRLVILHGMTHKVGPKGQVVIPKELRDEFGIEPGDEVVFWRDGDHIGVAAVHGSRPLKGRFSGRSLVDQLEGERAADRHREAAP